ncbi:MAG: hypothetical protein ACLFT3_04945 [Cyclobacteriaceae bacterium]
MSAVTKVLQRSLVVDFYRQHALFFLLLLLFAFGIMRPIEHIYILREAAFSGGILLFLLLIWTAYLVMVSRYALSVKDNPAKHFLQHTLLFPQNRRLRLAAAVYSLQILPVLVYALAALLMALHYRQWLHALFLMLFVAASYVPGFLIFLSYGSQRDYRTPWWLQLPFQKLRLPFWLFFFAELLQNHILHWVLVKAGGLGFLQLLIFLYSRDTYDERLLMTGALLIALLNSTLVYYCLHYWYSRMKFSLGLPISRGARLMQLLLSLGLLLLPEILLLLWRGPLGIATTGEAVLLALSLVVLIYTLQLARPLHAEKINHRSFAILIIFFLLIMYAVPPWLMLVINFGIGWLLFYRYCYRYEYVETK